MSKSKAQEFAQKRNTAGGTLKGVIINLERNILPVATLDEEENIEYAIKLLNEAYQDWGNSYEQAKAEHV